jgi:hypothetical protein
LDSIAAIFVQPIFSELTFDDFYAHENLAEKQKTFFQSCQSSICLENLPDLHSHPFQVTYLVELLRNFDEVLIDTGGVNELCFKNAYLEQLRKNKNIFSLVPNINPKPTAVKTLSPIDPIDFLIQDVYKELDLTRNSGRLKHLGDALEDAPEKVTKLYLAIKDETYDATTMLKASGLNAKDFDDNLEKLKFLLRKINLK